MSVDGGQNSRRLGCMPWPEASLALQRSGSTLVWPFGAFEQHGPQLPLLTDALFAQRILDRVLEGLPEEMPIWALPTQAIGLSPEHRGFPGTLSLSSELLIRLIKEVGQQLAAQGVKRLVLFNAHGGQIGLLQTAARELAAETPSMAVLPCFLWSGVSELKSLVPADELANGLHAGLAETSLMLALEPCLVGEQRPLDGDHVSEKAAATPPEGWSLEGPAPLAWFTADLSRSGVVGDSRGADARLGSQLETALAAHWDRLFTSLMASSWPPCGDQRRI
tara:strand:+ start:87 stop:920 length:834 start_codon:yes stop_codon:yes gene_type:complete